jgi:hypothetical protein
MLGPLERLRWWLRTHASLTAPRPPEASPPAQGFVGEHIYYWGDGENLSVDATCVDVSTDWVPLFDVEVVARGEVVESHGGLRGFTELEDLAASRGWVRRVADPLQQGSVRKASPGADEHT